MADLLARLFVALVLGLWRVAPPPPEPPVATVTVASPLVAATPAPAPVYAPPAAATPLREALAASAWPPALWPTVERLVACESGGSTTAVSPGGHVGLLQVDPRYWGYPPADAVGQLNQGYRVYLAQGWRAWSCY